MAGVVSFHGAIDPYVKPAEVDAFTKEMNDAKVDYQFVSYANAVHAFSNPGAGNNVAAGAAYNALADQRSQKAMKQFFEELTTKN